MSRHRRDSLGRAEGQQVEHVAAVGAHRVQAAAPFVPDVRDEPRQRRREAVRERDRLAASGAGDVGRGHAPWSQGPRIPRQARGRAVRHGPAASHARRSCRPGPWRRGSPRPPARRARPARRPHQSVEVERRRGPAAHRAPALPVPQGVGHAGASPRSARPTPPLPPATASSPPSSSSSRTSAAIATSSASPSRIMRWQPADVGEVTGPGTASTGRFISQAARARGAWCRTAPPPRRPRWPVPARR